MSPAQVVEHEYSLSPQSIENGIRVAGAQHSYVPALRLNGEWLRKAGFVAGRKVRVTVRVGTILLAALERIV